MKTDLKEALLGIGASLALLAGIVTSCVGTMMANRHGYSEDASLFSMKGATFYWNIAPVIMIIIALFLILIGYISARK